MLPEWSASLMEVDVELRRTNGAIAARSKAWIEVPPPRVQAAPKLDRAALEKLVQKGDRLLGRGDVVSARTLYQRAAELGSGPAALALGSTYDPNRLWSLGVFGMVGNKERARQWYARADQLGHPDAKSRLRTLGNSP
jgi:TPR repeat protein